MMITMDFHAIRDIALAFIFLARVLLMVRKGVKIGTVLETMADIVEDVDL